MFLEAAIACSSFFSIQFTGEMFSEVIDRPQTANDLAQFIFGQGCIPHNDDIPISIVLLRSHFADLRLGCDRFCRSLGPCGRHRLTIHILSHRFRDFRLVELLEHFCHAPLYRRPLLAERKLQRIHLGRIKIDRDITTNIMQETAKLLELDFTPTAENVHLIDMCGPGYAIPSPEGNAAIRMMAENEGLFLDPVYTGKAFAGLVKMAREGQFKPTDNVLYLYSGGAGGLFAIDIELD